MAAKTEMHLEHLLSEEVRDSEGKRAGRIEEVKIEERGGEAYVSEYLIGPYALLIRLAAYFPNSRIVRFLGWSPKQPHRIPWDQMDLWDPSHPRLKCRREELE